MPQLTDSKTEIVARLIKQFHPDKINKLLVVGCGSGLEAAILAQQLPAEVSGIDLKNEFDPEAAKIATLQTGDATALAFADETFDFIFSYHALEHIDNPVKALQEMRRVMKPGAGFWIGTPNRSRMIGYIGGKNTSFREKISWNILDWKQRIKGEFRNELGAHAGFTSKELHELLAGVFSRVDERTSEYFLSIYENKKSIIGGIQTSGLSRFIYPSVYFSGAK
ncbi:MAG TPA: class I SAM-dependent methyltransferase [Pyrinomonadaceae bacterium]|jgi:ubiquinone/menaquinone biosynthesis C-methylase UbiE|nr:class I SAM-dependent methyltransferase [Pyrinomonadaceae bacterium]